MQQPEDKFIAINGLSLHYLDWGNTAARPMLLLHGICANAHHWDFFASNVLSDYHVLALDWRGHGDSDRASSYTPEDYTLDLEAFTAKLELNDLVLMGHSLGGITGAIHAARNPERVSRLIIVDIGPELAPEGVKRIRESWADEPISFLSEEEAIRYMKQNDPLQSDAFARHQAKYALKCDDAGRLIFKYDRAVFDNEIRSPQWLWTYLEQVVCPTLLVHARQSDLLTEEMAQKIVHTLVFGTLAEIERSGHNVPGDNPEAFESAVRQFLIQR